MLNSDLESQAVPDEARKGLRAPRVVKLVRGQLICRFGNSQAPSQFAAASPWWVREQDYGRILAKVQPGKTSTGLAARMALAVKQSWGNPMDMVVRAVVLEDINTFCGLARTQYREQAPNGMFITWKGSADIEQLFLPGISQQGVGLTALGRRAIQVVERRRIDTFQLWEKRA